MAASVVVEPRSMASSQEPSLASVNQSNEHIVDEPTTIQGNSPGHRPASRRGTRRDRTSRKRLKQQQFQRALASMMESFQGIFEDSDADMSDLDDDHPHTSQPLEGDAYSAPQSDDDSGSTPSPRRRPRRLEDRRLYADGPQPITPYPDDPMEITDPPPPGTLPRRGTILEEVEPGPISFETELYRYSRLEGNDHDEPSLIDISTTPAPRKISKVGANAGSAANNGKDHIFKVVSMYSIPGRESRHRDPYFIRRPRRNSLEEFHERSPGDDFGRSSYPRGRPARPIPVTANVGSHLVIYSEVIMRAIRSCVKVWLGISRAFEFMCVSAPYALIVHYRDELQAYSDAILDEVQSNQDELPSPTTDRDDDTQEPNPPTVNLPPKQHIPLLLDYVFNTEFTATYDHEMSLRKKPIPSCTFALAWLLFRPGSMVYAWSGNSLDAYIVDWYDLEGLYGTDPNARKPRGLSELPRPPSGFRGELPEYSQIPKSILVKLHYLEYDGTRIGRRQKMVTITPFDGEREISTLPVYPIEYAQDPTLRESLIARGQKYFKLCQRHYMSYHSDTIATASTPSRKINGRVMIDSTTYYNDPESGGVLRLKLPTEDGLIPSDSSSASDSSGLSDSRYRHRRRRRRYTRRIKEVKKSNSQAKGMERYDLVEPTEANLTLEQFMLFPVQIWGFVLRERRWYLLHIDGLKEPKFQENIISDLVLKDEAKTLIEALSSTHSSAANGPSISNQENEGFNHWSADIVQNKGEGRIFLLHGKPGVGKTSTAECVAEASQAPLLAITCGDLGIEPHEVERALMKWFKLATLWKAVLLLDEADVYLESRMSGDLARNSLVSIFLRALEYYQGVLFLTTNRVGTFDEAMLSRIHVVLHDADFEDGERQKIWTTSFRKLGEERPDVKVGPGVMDYALENQRVLDLKWNGREIRNAFNTIVALAEFDAEKKRRAGRSSVQVSLERSHLVQVVKMSEEFKKYMKSTRGLDESALAKALKIRDDAAMQTIRGLASG